MNHKTGRLVIMVVLASVTVFQTTSGLAQLRTVAVNNQAAPGAGEGVNFGSFGAHPLSIGTENFRGPVINDAGQVAFRADLTGTGIDLSNDQGIWSEGSGSLSLVARTGSTAVGAPEGVSFARNVALELFEPVLNNSGQTAFYGGLSDGKVGVWSENSEGLRLVARDGMQVAGAVEGANHSFGVLRDFYPDLPYLNDAGQTSFFANLVGAEVDNTNDWAVWSERTGDLAMVARGGSPAPGMPEGVNFDSFLFQNGFNDAGQTAFFSYLTGNGVDHTNDNSIWSEASGSLTLVARGGNPAPGAGTGVNFHEFYWPVTINNSGQTAFGGWLTGEGVDDTNNESIWLEQGGNYSLVARTGNPAPGTPEGVKFSTNLRPNAFYALNDAGELAFRGHLSGTGVTDTNNLGIWSGEAGELELIARTGDQPPGTASGVRFSDLSRPALNSEGQVAFRGDLAGTGVNSLNNLGIWATDSTGELQLVVRKGASLEVAPGDMRTISDLGFSTESGNGDGRASSFNDLGQLVFWAKFTNNTQGVFVSDLVKIPVTQPGDFDGDGDVDGRDFLAWQRGESPNPLSIDDLIDWQENYGVVPEISTGNLSVPEPNTILLLPFALAAIFVTRGSTRFRSRRVPQVAVSLFFILALATSARADIYQWEYINPADPGEGKRQSTMLAPDGAGADAVPGALLSFLDLSMAHLAGAKLTEASFYGSTLTDADLTGAFVNYADFGIHPGSCSGYACFWPIGTGISLPQLYSTTSYQLKNLSGVGFSSNDLTNGNFAGQNLTGSSFILATLDGADFSDAVIERADFTALSYSTVFQTGIRPAQLYETASYKNKNLNGVGLSYNNLSAVNLSGQNLSSASFMAANLTNADFRNANLTNANFNTYNCGIEYCFPTLFATVTGADFTGADTRGMGTPLLLAGVTANLISPEGHMSGLDLESGAELVLRDYDGNPLHAHSLPIPITVDQHLAMAPGGVLRMVFEADAWDSTISFAPGIPVTLGGTLELTFADEVNLATQRGRTFDLFDWTGVAPTGEFGVNSPYEWDLANLYTTGKVTLIAIPEPSAEHLFVIFLTTLVGITRLQRCLLLFTGIREAIRNSKSEFSRFVDLRRALPILTVAVFHLLATSSSAQPVVVSYDHFTSRLAPHSFPGGLPVGDKVQIAAVINSNDPVGSSAISVQAVQGDTTLALDYIGPGHPLFQGLHIYYKFIDLDSALLGPWRITPTDSTGTGPSVFTNSIPEPEFLPFVNDITLGGTPLGARLSWTQPNLIGYDPNGIGIRIIEAASGSHVWQDVLPLHRTAYEPPAGILKVGVDYVYNIILSDDETFGHENASWSFSETFRYMVAGDFDFDGDVDGRDFLAWQRGESPNPLSIDDLTDWQENYGVAPELSTGNLSVPEPTTLGLLTIAVVAICRRGELQTSVRAVVLFIAAATALTCVAPGESQAATVGYNSVTLADNDQALYVSGRVPTSVKGPVRGGTNINSLVGADTFYTEGYTGTNAVIANIEGGHIWSGHETLTHVQQIQNHPSALNEFDRHATWVGAVLGGRQGGDNPGPYQEGMAPDAQLFSGNIISQWTGPRGSFAYGSIFDSVLYDQYRRAFSTGVDEFGRTADVINSSYGGDVGSNGSQSREIGLDGLANANPRTLFVVSAGNDGVGPDKVRNPAAMYNNMAVAALGANPPYDRPAWFSSGGPNDYQDPINHTKNNARQVVDIAAPGENLAAAYYGGETGSNGTTDNPTAPGPGPMGLPYGPIGGPDFYTRGQLNGTSLAAPTVAGGAALLYDAAYDVFTDNPDARDARVMKSVLMNSADKTLGWNNGQVPHPNGLGGVLTTQGLDNRVGTGRLNLTAAYDQFLSGTTDVDGILSGNQGIVLDNGWDFGQVINGTTNDYFFSSPLVADSMFTATLSWFRDRRLTTSNSVVDDSYDNLNLELWSVVDGSIDSLISESSSLYNESEHFSFAVPFTGDYALRVRWQNEVFDRVADADQELYGLAWWAGAGLQAISIPEPEAWILVIVAASTLSLSRTCQLKPNCQDVVARIGSAACSKQILLRFVQ